MSSENSDGLNKTKKNFELSIDTTLPYIKPKYHKNKKIDTYPNYQPPEKNYRSIRGNTFFPKKGWLQSCYFCKKATSKHNYYIYKQKKYKIYCCSNCKNTYSKWKYKIEINTK